MVAWLSILGLVLVPVLLSFLVEARRRPPQRPVRLPWAPETSTQVAVVGGVSLRYVAIGSGPPLVLLHTLRTQLDLFQKVIPSLSSRFTVIAPDYPGHGHSDIPEVDYTPDLFVNAVADFLETLDVRDATVAGISIGGSIALLLAARGNPRVRRVVAINPYDYAGGMGMGRASPVARVVVTLGRIPVVGETVMRLRNPLVERKIFEGGVGRPDALPPSLLREFYEVGQRRGHYRAFLNLLRNAAGWERARSEYDRVRTPVLLVYGDRDWSTPQERDANLRLIPGARMVTVENGGHFLALDRPERTVQLISDFAVASDATSGPPGAAP